MKNFLGMFAALFMLASAPTLSSAATSPETVEGATTVSVETAAELFDQNVVFVDVRKGSDFDAGRIPGAVHLDIKSALTEASLAEVVKTSDPVVFYCNGHSCMRSSDASRLAVGWGYTNVHYLRDGYPAWESAGFPVE